MSEVRKSTDGFDSLTDPRVQQRIEAAEARVGSGQADDGHTMAVEELDRLIDELRAKARMGDQQP